MLKYRNKKFPSNYHGKGFIELSRKLRKLAYSDKIEVDINQSISEDTGIESFVKLIESFGISVDEFVRDYLSIIQPYMLSTYKNKKMHGARMYTCNIAYKIQLLIIINKDKNEPITIAFIKENTIVNEVVKVRRTENDLHAVLINTVIHKLYGFSICYWVQIGFLKYRFKDYCHYYNKDIALIELETIGDWFDVTLRTFFKTVQNKYEQSEGRALTVGKKRGDELSFLSHGFHNINTVYSMIDMFDDSDTAERKTIASVCSTMLTEMSLKEQLQLRELLQEKNKKYHDNALYNIVIDTIARGE